ncbi:MAG TPA: glycosyltransferase [bacterium]|nr:glycosyltransferase [bacterium]
MIEMILFIVMGVYFASYVFGVMWILMGLFFPHRVFSKKQPKVSVIVAARNEADNIRYCAESLAAQDYPKDQYEIILVNDRSEDQTLAIMQAFVKKFPEQFRIVSVQDKPLDASGKKYALKQGIEAAVGEILLFTDADCTVGPQWITTMASYFSDKTDFVIGFSEVRAVTTFERWQRTDFLAMMIAAAGVSNLGMPWSASGQNLAYRRKAYDAVGGLDPIMHRISGDDILMMNRMRQNGAGIVFAMHPGAYVQTEPVPDWSTFMRQRARWASNGPIMLRYNLWFFCYLTIIYGVCLGLITSLAAGIFLKPWLWLGGFMLVVKAIVDSAAMMIGSRQLQKKVSPTDFIYWFAVQPFYVVWSGLRGMLGIFTWK